MTDFVVLRLLAGNGGDGRVSFRREKYVHRGGPDGGDGADGGVVIIRATKSLATLKQYAGSIEFAAQHGQAGGKKKSYGKKGESTVLEVPLGTEVWSVAENHIARQRRQRLGMIRLLRRGDVAREKFYLEREGMRPEPRQPDDWITALDGEELAGDSREVMVGSAGHEFFAKHPQKVLLGRLSEDEQELVVCQGGFGGLGNTAFKASTNTTPLEAEFGTTGEKRVIILELKLLADAGLVGFPNAGKSTLLSVVSGARPKVASYPFTTLEPQLGVVSRPQTRASRADATNEFVLADLPGLIAGAHEGKGLGHQFLRHVENCRVLVFVLSLDETVVFDEDLSPKQKAAALLEQYQQLQTELENHNTLLQDKKRLLVVNKIDLYDEALKKAVVEVFADAAGSVDSADAAGSADSANSAPLEPILMSGATGVGVDELVATLARAV